MESIERDKLFEMLTDTKEINRLLLRQVDRIENREGSYWKSKTQKEIEEKVVEYEKMIEENNEIIKSILYTLSKEFKLGL